MVLHEMHVTSNFAGLFLIINLNTVENMKSFSISPCKLPPRTAAPPRSATIIDPTGI